MALSPYLKSTPLHGWLTRLRRLSKEQNQSDVRFLRLLKHREIDLLIDAGANSGQYAAWLRSLGFMSPIVSFEPVSSAYAALEATAARHGSWICRRQALGDAPGTAVINVSGENGAVSSSILPLTARHRALDPRSAATHTETIDVVRLDTVFPAIVGLSRHPFLKIDVQGYEKWVLEGARGCLDRIDLIQLELSLSPVYENEMLLPEGITFLEGLGFELVGLIPEYADATGRLWQTNALFWRAS